MRKTKDQEFVIKSCVGDEIGRVVLRIPADADEFDYRHKAIQKAGFRQHVCDGCYDLAYSAEATPSFRSEYLSD